MDMFASRLNYKVTDYVAWRPEPVAAFIEAFCVNWEPYFFYAFPSFSLIPRCLTKIENDQATGVLIVRYWTTQSWFTLLSGQPFSGQPTASSSVRQLVTIASHWGTTPPSKENEINRMQTIWKSLLQRDVSHNCKATEIIMHSWADASLKQYKP
ncbi:hypothetical protein P5673_014406 [Acropora cervicornis]|uniref:Uncharacterized protein n=1 Tax=Acropora cervicornis TaxID=6130 RepID=A0AAD9V6N4_ACRCE|nr:hypothetical protein P5673_014406 [Acropora cervicornis]